MSSFGQCCRKFYFLVLSIVGLGVVLAILIAGLVLGLKLQLFKADGKLVIYFIVATVITVLIFLFSVWISCHPSRRARIILAIFFLVYALAIVALGVLAFLIKNSIVDDIASLWDGTDEATETAVNALEDAFKCCGWNATRENCTAKSNESCNVSITDAIQNYWPIGAGVLLAFGVLLVIAIGVAFKLTCSEKEKDVELKSLGAASKLTDPLDAGGSSADSKGHIKYTW
jgi:hypothetical protein